MMQVKNFIYAIFYFLILSVTLPSLRFPSSIHEGI
jgi:hypothetical protein